MLPRANSAILFELDGSGSGCCLRQPMTKFPDMTICDDPANERVTR